MRVIAHVDMDAFFAAVELVDHPEYSGQPLVIGADPREGKGRGVVSTCSYEARALGIHSAMPISQAFKLAPSAVFLPVNMDRYIQVSEEVMEVLREFSDDLERASIDEAYLDLTEYVEDEAYLDTIGYMIQKRVKRRTGLPCSVGIGPNKAVAKIASGLQKPGGVVVVGEGEAAAFLASLPVRLIPGVGTKMHEELAERGIFSIGELASASVDGIKKRFGSWGERVWNIAHGWDDSPVEERAEASSIGREHTFDEDTLERREINRILRRLALETLRDLDSRGLTYRTVVLKVRFSDFETLTRSRTFHHHLATADGIWEALNKLTEVIYDKGLDKSKGKGGKKVRLLGVRLSGLENFKGQTTLDYWLHVSSSD